MNVDPHTTIEELATNLTVPEMAAFLRISRSAAYALVRQKGFPSTRLGRRIIIPKANLISWLEKEHI